MTAYQSTAYQPTSDAVTLSPNAVLYFALARVFHFLVFIPGLDAQSAEELREKLLERVNRMGAAS